MASPPTAEGQQEGIGVLLYKQNTPRASYPEILGPFYLVTPLGKVPHSWAVHSGYSTTTKLLFM